MRKGWEELGGGAYRRTYSESLFADVEPNIMYRGRFLAKGYIQLTEENWITLKLGVGTCVEEAMAAAEEGLRRVKQVVSKVD